MVEMNIFTCLEENNVALPYLGEALMGGIIVNPDYFPAHEKSGMRPLIKIDSKKVKLFTSPPGSV
ncbi:MAG: hypothetical protein WCB46_04225 [Methanoregula sp.]